jgi:hypothetical protein
VELQGTLYSSEFNFVAGMVMKIDIPDYKVV